MPLSRMIVALVLVSGCSAAAAQAAEFEGSVPVDLVRYFAGGGDVSRELPPDFPAFSMPDGIRLMGSFARSYEEKILLRTTLGGEEAEQALVGALLATGWRRPAPNTAGRRNRSPEPDDSTGPTRLCHEEFGFVEVRGRDGTENRVYLRRYNFMPEQRRRQDCLGTGRDARAPGGSLDVTGSLLAYQPSLYTEEGTTLPMPVLAGGEDAGIMAPLPGEDTPPRELVDYYADQLREQGWRLDAQWAGEAGAGSAWTLTPREDLRLFFRLEFLAPARGDLEVAVSLRAID